MVKRLDEHKKTVWKEVHGVEWGKVAVLGHHHSLHEHLSLEGYHITRQPLAFNGNQGLLPDV